MRVRSLAWGLAIAIVGCATNGGNNPDGGDGDAASDAIFGDAKFGDAKAPDGGNGGCSGDLRDIVDGSGNVVSTCPPDQGCLAGACVPACTAAAGSHGYLGCDYLLPVPSFHPGMAPACFTAFVSNDWPKPATITVTRGGVTYDVTKFGRVPNGGSDATTWPAVPSTGLPQGSVAVIFLTDDGSFACPVVPAIKGNAAVWSSATQTSPYPATGRGQAFHIAVDFPVTTYDILPYGGAKSFLPGAELALPTSAWGTNYVAAVPKRGAPVNWGPQFGQVTAAQDGTTLTIVPTTDLPAGTNVAAANNNVVTTFSLSAGEYIQWQDAHEMSGSILSSNNPVVFSGGNGYECLASATTSQGDCDTSHQMIPPISALGSEYVASPYVTRLASLADESIPYRVVGVVDNTTLAFDPPVSGAPPSLSRGQFADFETTIAFAVASQDAQHPFYIAQQMPGCPSSSRAGYQVLPNQCDQCLCGPDLVNVLPPAQFLQKYVFFTDPTYWTTNFALVRVKDGGGFHDVSLDCLGNVTGWKDVGTSGRFQVTTAEIMRGNVGVGSCTNGTHTATSTGAFGITVWGTDCASSYAYPAGGNVGTINSVIVPPVPK